MYTYPPTRNNSLRRSLLVNSHKDWMRYSASPMSHKERVYSELRNAGATRFVMARAESKYLPHVIHPEEHIKAVVYGYHEDGFTMLVATDLRVIFLDKKPLFVNEDEITYAVVGGVSFSHAGFGSTLTLHTRVKDFAFRTFNLECAKKFINYIEFRCLERKAEKLDYPML